MKMEMTYRDKMIILGLLVVIILIAGFFALIKPKYDELQTHTATLEQTQSEWDAIEVKLDAIGPMKDAIKADYNAAKKTAAIFVNSAFATANKTYASEHTSYEIDQYLQTAIDESKLIVTAMEIADVNAETMEYYYYTPNVLTYSLLEAADVNSNYAAEAAVSMLDSLVLSERETVDLMCETVNLTVEGKKADLMSFLDKIALDSNAVLVKSVTIDDYQFHGGLETTQIGPDGQPIVVIDENGVGTSTMTISVSFYNAKEIDEPDLGA